MRGGAGNAVLLPDVASGSGKPAGVEKTTVVWKATRVRHMDYGVQNQQTDVYPSAEKVKISPCSAPSPTYRGCTTRSSPTQEEFERLYTKYEKDDSIRKQRVKAVELFSLMMQERASTRSYLYSER